MKLQKNEGQEAKKKGLTHADLCSNRVKKKLTKQSNTNKIELYEKNNFIYAPIT